LAETVISCIGPGMTVVGKISSEGTLSVLGRVEGELHASIVRISDGAQVEGTIAAQELTIGGLVSGMRLGRLEPLGKIICSLFNHCWQNWMQW
jgi:cytoskeletal protein CcmA (bactofilin family)